jgi:hypothetical protein
MAFDRNTKTMTTKELMEAELCAAQIAEWSHKCDRRCPIANMFGLFIGIIQENKSLKSQIKEKFEYPSK